MRSISQRLSQRTRSAGGDPLITYYDLGTGDRTELSAITVSNWVDKTCALLAHEHGLDLGDVVLLDLARTDPGHWVTAIWELACWRLGGCVAVGDAPGSWTGPEPRLVVAGPEYAPAAELAAGLGADLLACRLHPLGLPFAERLPVGVIDYGLEVRGQPDQFAAGPVPGTEPAWRSSEAGLSQAELAALAGSPARRMLRPATPWQAVRDGVVSALIGGGSVVVVVGDDGTALQRIRETEMVEDST